MSVYASNRLSRPYYEAAAKLKNAMLKVSDARSLVKDNELLHNYMTETICNIEHDIKEVEKTATSFRKKRRSKPYDAEYAHTITV